MSSEPDKETRERLLESAARLFAEHGFRVTTVKDICAAAGANVAAVNYYFGSKDKLIDEVWGHTFRVMQQVHGTRDLECLAPMEQVKALIRVRLRAVLDDGPGGQFPKVVFRALSEYDHSTLEPVFFRHVRPQKEILERALRALLPATATEQEIAAAALCIHSPCIHINFARHERRGPFRDMHARGLAEEALIEPMVSFIVGGLTTLRDRIAARDRCSSVDEPSTAGLQPA